MALREGVRQAYETAGAFGVIATALNRTAGWPTVVKVQAPGLPNRVRLRLRTTDASTYRSILAGDEYRFPLDTPPATIIDAGANIGMASLAFVRRYPRARIIALEPEPDNFAMLVKNVEPYPQITPVHAALWSEDAELNIVPAADGGEWGFRTLPGRNGLRVPALSISTLQHLYGLGRIDLLKVDIEGAEAEVFGAPTWLDQVGVIFIEVHGDACAVAVSRALAGFTCETRGETSVYRHQP